MPTIDRQAIMDCLSRLVTPGIKLTALADDLGLRKQDYSELRSHVLELVEEGIVSVLPGGAFALAPMGRPADPHSKPLPSPPPAPRMKPPKPPKKEAPGRGLPGRPTLAPKRAALPWAAKPRTSVVEEYDQETGEIRIK